MLLFYLCDCTFIIVLSLVAESSNQNLPPSSPIEAAELRLSPVHDSKQNMSSSPVKEITASKSSPGKETDSPKEEDSDVAISDQKPESKQLNKEEASENIKENLQEQSRQTEKVLQEKPPLPVKKPPVEEKPLVLPKPVLLPKPDKPMQFVGMLCCIFTLFLLLSVFNFIYCCFSYYLRTTLKLYKIFCNQFVLILSSWGK